MNIVKLHRFNAHVSALEMGYGIVGRPLMNVHCYLEEITGRVRLLAAKGLSEREIIRRLDRRQDRLVKIVTMGNASFANMVRSALRAA
jgi:hypothetical protein